MRKLLILIIIDIFLVNEIFADNSSYTTRYNHIDIDKILENDRLLEAALNCLYTGTVCTTEGKTLRKIIPEAIRTGCGKCSDIQKYHALKVIEFLMKEKPGVWEKLLMIYDPKGVNRARWASFIQKIGLHF